MKSDHRRTQTEDKEKLSLRLKPDERFFKYQDNYLKHTLNDVNHQPISIKNSEINKSSFSPQPKRDNLSNINNIKTLTLGSNYNGIKYPYAVSNDEKNENYKYVKEKSKSLNKLYQSEDNMNTYVTIYFIQKGMLNLSKNLSNFLIQKQLRQEEESKKMVNPYSMKKIDIGETRIKDNLLVFNESPYNVNKTENTNSSLKYAGSRVLQNY